MYYTGYNEIVTQLTYQVVEVLYHRHRHMAVQVHRVWGQHQELETGHTELVVQASYKQGTASKLTHT